MKYWIVVKEEMRTTTLPSLLIFLSFVFMGINQLSSLVGKTYGVFGSGEYSSNFIVNYPTPLSALPQFMQIACLALGISVAWVQFGRPSWHHEWSFLLHRPIRRWQLIALKLLGAAVPLLLLPMLAWFWLWQSMMDMPVWEFTAQQLFQGWLYPCWGYAVYMAVALTIMNKDAWPLLRSAPLLLLVFILALLYGAEGWSVTEGMMACTGTVIIFMLQLISCVERRTF